jgi:hypothetical protein
VDWRRFKGPYEGDTFTSYVCVLLLHLSMLLQVLLPALQGHIPSAMITAIQAFLELCYLIRRETHTERSLRNITNTLCRFHHHRRAFVVAGILPDGISLPRQHALVHYCPLIEAFGSPNGLCSSITELKHIKAVKEPWRRSNKYKALGQILVTNQRLEKLASARVDFGSRSMLKNTTATAELNASERRAQALSITTNKRVNSLSPTPLSIDSNECVDGLSLMSSVEGISGPITSLASALLVEDADEQGVRQAASHRSIQGEGDGDSVEYESGPVDGTRVDAHAELARKRGEHDQPI